VAPPLLFATLLFATYPLLFAPLLLLHTLFSLLRTRPCQRPSNGLFTVK